MRFVWFWVFVLISSLCFGEFSLSKAVEFMSKGDYSNAINVLLSIEKTKDNERVINYYLSECYLLLKDFSNCLVYGERTLSQKNDFVYKRSLYNVVFSSYMLNIFDKTSAYGVEYLKEVGDSQGVESLVLTMVVDSFVSLGNFERARDILNTYRAKYPTLYSLLTNNLEKFARKTKVGVAEGDRISEERVSFYLEVLRDILVSLENISKKRDSEIEKLEEIMYLLELKERALKVKKYQLMFGR